MNVRASQQHLQAPPPTSCLHHIPGSLFSLSLWMIYVDLFSQFYRNTIDSFRARLERCFRDQTEPTDVNFSLFIRRLLSVCWRVWEARRRRAWFGHTRVGCGPLAWKRKYDWMSVLWRKHGAEHHHGLNRMFKRGKKQICCIILYYISIQYILISNLDLSVRQVKVMRI